jgi:hypothetical protein
MRAATRRKKNCRNTGAGFADIAHVPRRYHARDDQRILALYGYI